MPPRTHSVAFPLPPLLFHSFVQQLDATMEVLPADEKLAALWENCQAAKVCVRGESGGGEGGALVL